MSMFRIMLVAVLVAAILVGAVIFVGRWRSVIYVTVINESSHAVNDLHITHRFADIEYLPTLAAGEKFATTLVPSRGAGVRISYRNSKGELEVNEADVYARAGGEEAITIRIQEAGIITD